MPVPCGNPQLHRHDSRHSGEPGFHPKSRLFAFPVSQHRVLPLPSSQPLFRVPSCVSHSEDCYCIIKCGPPFFHSRCWTKFGREGQKRRMPPLVSPGRTPSHPIFGLPIQLSAAAAWHMESSVPSCHPHFRPTVWRLTQDSRDTHTPELMVALAHLTACDGLGLVCENLTTPGSAVAPEPVQIRCLIRYDFSEAYPKLCFLSNLQP